MAIGENVVRLEQALRLWEDLAFLLRTRVETAGVSFPVRGPLIHAPKLREHLLVSMHEYFDYEKFVGSIQMWGQFMHTGSLPQDLFSWSRNSRRVFQLPSNLQAILSATSLDGIYWPDVVWPLRSFAISLEDPIIDAAGNKFDFLLASNIGGCTPEMEDVDCMSFSIFSKNLDDYHPLNADDRNKIPKLIRKRGADYVEKLDRRIHRMGKDYMDSFFVTIKGINGGTHPDPVNKPLKEGFIKFNKRLKESGKELGITLAADDITDEDPYGKYSALEKALHLIISFSLFLTTLPTGSRPANSWSYVPGEKVQNKKFVTHKSQICTINLQNFLHTDDFKLAETIRQCRNGGEKCVHFRRGTFRKRPGQRDNPDAPKCIMVKPSLVNKDKVLAGTLSPGSKTIVV